MCVWLRSVDKILEFHPRQFRKYVPKFRKKDGLFFHPTLYVAFPVASILNSDV
jgi:hypothetical protein